ncbi:hypothetical protein ACH5RR_007367 [Cinchona calisaya]|uniref:Bet v I/Major latex protein domain-containing protein n=1 Tax=Cinchona calisaya TaxID=153742 RepID=A0ABD3ARQ6_9GENT
MGETGRLIGQVELKFDGNVFYEMFRYRTDDISDMSPDKMREIALHDGKWGTVGSHVVWRFTLDGKEKVSKEVIEAIDEENKTITYKAVEGDLLELYKIFKFIIHVDTKGGNNMVRVTLEYEKLSKDIPDPNSLMDFCLNVVKDVEACYV